MSTYNKSFDEISYENIYGEETKCLEHKNDFHKLAVNVKLLLEDIQQNINSKSTFYNYQKYTDNLPKITLNEDEYLKNATPLIRRLNGVTDVYFSIPFRFNDQKSKKEKVAPLNVALNKRACTISFKDLGMAMRIDIKNKRASYGLEFIYTDALDKRDFNNASAAINDYTLDEKYRAIIIETGQIDGFIAVLRYLNKDHFLNQIRNKFQVLLENTTKIEDLVFLYSLLPSDLSFLKGGQLKMDTVFNHMKLLAEYDNNSGFFSIFNDESGALIKALELLMQFPSALQILLTEDTLIKNIYKNLDGSSVIENEHVENKMLFASLLNAIMVQNKFHGAKDKRDKKFYYGNDYKFNGDITSLFSDEKEDEFYLQQLKKTTRENTSPEVITDDMGVSISEPSTYAVTEKIDQGAMYHPLDLVTLEILQGKNSQTLLVPAIYIKALSDRDEWMEVEKNIRIGFDVLALVGGIVVLLTTANPGLLALAIADIGLATTDIAVQTIANELKKTPEGQEFLDTWEKIYLIGGMATALASAPQLIQSLYKSATGVIRLAAKVKNYNYLNFTRSILLKAFLEMNASNFTQNTVKALRENTEIVLATGGYLDKIKVDELFKKSVILVSGNVQTNNKIEEQVALVYKGEVIVQSNPQNFGKSAKTLLKNLANEKKFFEVCEELWNNKSYKFIELLDAKRKPLGEFDEIFHNKRIFVEDKSAEGLLRNINPLTGMPWSTFEAWAQKQIYDKTYVRIRALEIATHTRPRLLDGLHPNIHKIRDIRKLEFHIDEKDASLQEAVFNEITRLKNNFPNWEFTAKFGKTTK